MTQNLFDITGRKAATRDTDKSPAIEHILLPDYYPADATGAVRVTNSIKTDGLIRQIDLPDKIDKDYHILISLTPQTEIPLRVMTRALEPVVAACEANKKDVLSHFTLRYHCDQQRLDAVLPHRRQLCHDFQAAVAICHTTNRLRDMACDIDTRHADLDPVYLPNPRERLLDLGIWL